MKTLKTFLTEGFRLSHTELVRLVLDATRSSGVLYHTLPASVRDKINSAAKRYMTAHASTSLRDMSVMQDAESEILRLLGK